MYITLTGSPRQYVVDRSMVVDDILEQHNLTREITARYIEPIVYKNQSDTPDAIGVSRQTINRYKNAFADMTTQECLILISAFAQEQLLTDVGD